MIRFAELYHQVRFPQALALLQRWRGLPPLIHAAADFYQIQLHRHPEAVAYLLQRGLHQNDVIEELHIGYAPGRCLRAWLTGLGYPLESLQQAGLVNMQGLDTFNHRIVFPLEGNLYGRSTGAAAPHRFLPGRKGGLYAWDRIRKCKEIILVEGMFDLAVLWQTGFRNATCVLGNRPNSVQFRQLCDEESCSRTVYLAFDSDANGSGQSAVQGLSQRLRAQGVPTRNVELPDGHDPNSFFASGGNACDFQSLLERAC